MWTAVIGLIAEIRRCEAAGAKAAALAMAYICIDTMTYLSLPPGKAKQGRADFITWVDTYLMAHSNQPYQYRGIDVYAARCAFLHAFGSEADLHQDPDIHMFGYHDGGQHTFDPTKAPRLVMIGTASFLNDIVLAVESFLKKCQEDATLRTRVEPRLLKIIQTFPLNS